MKKRKLELSSLYEMQERDIDSFSKVLAKGFEGYSLFEYFCNNNYDLSKMQLFWKVALTASYGSVYSVSDSVNSNGVAVFFPPEYKDIGIMSYFTAGGYKLLNKLNVGKMLKFDSFAAKIKKKYVNENTWYLYSFAVLKNARGKGIGSKLLRPMLKYFDNENQSCYLETLKEENVELYQHYGFKLVEKVEVPGTDMTLYAMFREAK